MSAGVKVYNESDVTIDAKLFWGYSRISSHKISPNDYATLSCGYVFYDLKIFNDNTDKELVQKNGVYGSSSWNFAGNVHDGYSLESR